MKVGFIGLGRMGSQMVGRLLNHGHRVVVFDVDPAAVQHVRQLGATGAADRGQLVSALGQKPIVWLMIPSQFVEDEVNELLQVLPAGSIIIDGGNSDYRKTLQRYSRCKEKGIELVDVGTSGGVLGFKQGFSMMIGGEASAVRYIEPLIKVLAQTHGYRHFGPTGTGHYIKMVHNAVEYGVMESYAEGYRLLREGPMQDIDLAGVADAWQNGSIVSSALNGLSADIFRNHPHLEHTQGVVRETGETTWALEVARETGVDLPAIEAAVQVRKASEKGATNFGTRLLAALRHAFGGHPL